MGYEDIDKDYDQSSSDNEGDLFETEPTELGKSIQAPAKILYVLGNKEDVNNFVNDNTQNNLNNDLLTTINSVNITDKEHICLLCYANVNNIAKLHIEQHPVGELFLHKDKPFAKLIELTLSMMTTDVPYKCQLCDAALTDKNSVMYHYSYHLGHFDVFIDSIMNRRFQALQPILDAMPSINPTSNAGPKYVKGDYDHPCTFCDGFFQSRPHLCTHLMICYNKNLCGKVVTNLNNMREHEKGKVCEICGMPVKNYEDHLRTHMKSQCGRCGKVFARKFTLEKHLAEHLVENKYKCMHCEEKFRTSAQLKEHTKIHPMENIYLCFFCKQEFTDTLALLEHFRICQITHKYKCKHCEENFNTDAELKEHTKIHPMENIYLCFYCKQGFAETIALRNHFKICQKTHNKNNESSNKEL